MLSFSFCKPSRGPTSTILTCCGNDILISPRCIDDAANWQTLFEGLHFFCNLRDAFFKQTHGRHVWRDLYARLLPERMFGWQRFLLKYIQCRASDVTTLYQTQ